MKKAVIGVVGIGVMGGNLARNIERHGFPVISYGRNPDKVRAFLEGPASGTTIQGTSSVEELAAALEKPRRIVLMVTAGAAVDDIIENLKPFLEAGDVLIDGGNSYFMDSERRSKELAAAGLHFVGMGVSGGETGALWGPSLMPGGSREAWESLASILRAIAARAPDGEPCVAYIGPRGAGHYVKMVHNGIEYGDMQLIAESYDLLQRALGLQAPELAEIFSEWNEGVLQSYLIEITANIFRKIDPDTGKPLVELILDEAEQKGTGKWTSQNALDVGAPVPTLSLAVESRILSSLKAERVQAARLLSGPKTRYHGSAKRLIEAARDALYASKVVSYAQGMAMLRMASTEYDYNLKLDEIAAIWRAGCIIRAALLGDIMHAYRSNPALPNLLLDPTFRQAVESRQTAWRFVLQTAIGLGIPMPATAASLAYFDAYRSVRLPANLTQAQRDYFGAHTYRRIDREGVFHTEWE
jgi:6-phosphogluconate dehydrogenase